MESPDKIDLFAITKAALELVQTSSSRLDFMKGLAHLLVSSVGLEGVRILRKNPIDTVYLESMRGQEAFSDSYFVFPASFEVGSGQDFGLPDEIENFIHDHPTSTYSSREDHNGNRHLETYDFKVCLPFNAEGEEQGLLVLLSPKEHLLGFPRAVLNDLAFIVGLTMRQRSSQLALKERIKELTCLYEIAQISRRPDWDLTQKIDAIVSLLPSAWQYPDLASSKIEFEGKTFVSEPFNPSPNALSAQIRVGQRAFGEVTIYYDDAADRAHLTQNRTPAFLHEERQLIEGVAREVGNLLDRHHAEREKKELFRQLRHADRLATVGQLTAGVAHEINEPLANILGFAQLIQKQRGLPEQSRKDLDHIVNSALFSREIIKKLMIFSRQTASKKVLVDIHEKIENTLELLGARFKKSGIEVKKDFDSDIPLILGDPSQMQQVYVNLIVNALHAMKQGGELRLSSQLNGPRIELIVEDTGEGIPEENLPHIFEPFFTTKDVGEGTGLGLAVVHGIITSHGGSIKASSMLNAGTRFEIQLPAKG